jgi:hypothetical protein
VKKQLPIAFQGAVYQCGMCGVQSTDPSKLCLPVRKKRGVT